MMLRLVIQSAAVAQLGGEPDCAPPLSIFRSLSAIPPPSFDCNTIMIVDHLFSKELSLCHNFSFCKTFISATL